MNSCLPPWLAANLDSLTWKYTQWTRTDNFILKLVGKRKDLFYILHGLNVVHFTKTYIIEIKPVKKFISILCILIWFCFRKILIDAFGAALVNEIIDYGSQWHMDKCLPDISGQNHEQMERGLPTWLLHNTTHFSTWFHYCGF